MATAPPLSHHDVLTLVAPFSRRGRPIDLAASDRGARKLLFRPVEHPAADGRPALRERYAIARDAVVVGAVGHLRPEKNVARLLRAVARCAPRCDVHALVLGEGPERAGLEELARVPELSGRVHFAGYHADPREHYRAMDVFALTSDTEQMPIALLEAMASSLPVMATDVGDVRAMLPQSQQRYVASLDDQTDAALSRILMELAASREVRSELGSANRERVAQCYSHAHMVASYRALIDAV